MKNNLFLKISVAVTYLAMITVNSLANILPINGLNTGQVSDSYPNLFAPTGLTFSIWGLIYLLLAIYVVYQFFPKSPQADNLLGKINLFFIISSVANSVWIFLWHYQLILPSVLLMLVILLSLIKISLLSTQAGLAPKDRLFVKIPFGVYFGWITIATVANITTLLVSLGWKNLLFPDQIWMVIILLVATAIAAITTLTQKNLAYGLVPIWAYFGIWLKHTSPLEFNYQYPLIINTVIFCIIIFLITNSLLLFKKSR